MEYLYAYANDYVLRQRFCNVTLAKDRKTLWPGLAKVPGQERRLTSVLRLAVGFGEGGFGLLDMVVKTKGLVEEQLAQLEEDRAGGVGDGLVGDGVHVDSDGGGEGHNDALNEENLKMSFTRVKTCKHTNAN